MHCWHWIFSPCPWKDKENSAARLTTSLNTLGWISTSGRQPNWPEDDDAISRNILPFSYMTACGKWNIKKHFCLLNVKSTIFSYSEQVQPRNIDLYDKWRRNRSMMTVAQCIWLINVKVDGQRIPLFIVDCFLMKYLSRWNSFSYKRLVDSTFQWLKVNGSLMLVPVYSIKFKNINSNFDCPIDFIYETKVLYSDS